MGSSTGKGHWIKPLATSSLPSHVISLSVSASVPSDRPGQSRYQFTLGKWAAVHRSRHPERETDIREKSGTTAAEWWLYLQSVCRKGRRVWILSPDAAAAFRVLGGWEYSDSGLISWGRLTNRAQKKKGKRSPGDRLDDCSLVLSPACTILTHRIGLARATWVSTTNYLPLALSEWADAVGIEYPPVVGIGPGGESFQTDPATSAAVIDRYFAGIMGNYLRDGGGHWRATAAQLSHQTWRRSHYTHPVLAHENVDAHRLERDALFGGRAEVNFFGTIGDPPGLDSSESAGPPPASDAVLDGPVYVYDVRSQYPAILRDRPFPIALDRIKINPTIKSLESHLKHDAVIARVEIETPSPDYPVRLGGGVRVSRAETKAGYKRSEEKKSQQVCFPIGTYWTTLCGPELLHAIRHDRIRRVGLMAVYQSAPAFHSFAKFMIGNRRIAQENGDPSGSALSKLLANSFVGKFASKGGGWRTVAEKAPPERWGEWPEVDAESGEVISWRSLSGVSQRWHPVPTGPVGIPSIFAYCTSYGRLQLLEMIESAGAREWLWCHTDGIALTSLGHQKILQSPVCTSGKAGAWREIGIVSRLRCWGPSHYFCDGVWTLSGWSDGAWFDSRGTCYDWRRDEISKLIAASGSAAVGMTLRRSQIQASTIQGTIDPHGFAIPATLRAGDRVPNWVSDD